MTIQITSKGLFASINEFYFPKESNLGVGSFGTVKLGIHRETQRKYAIKIINLKQLSSDTQLGILERQIKLHSQLDHPHIIKLWDTIAEDESIYMILEYASNGSLFHYQNKYGKFSENESYRYFYQTLKALAYMHSNNMMHRDIKNLLLDHELNIKLCDFGWATLDINEKRETFCGTYQYMAPEMANREPYDYRIDVWAIGILLFELTHGFAPFKATSLEEIQQKIRSGTYELDNALSKDLRVLIMKILQFKAENRPELQSILLDPWVQGIMDSFFEQNVLKEENQNRESKTKKALNKVSKQSMARLGDIPRNIWHAPKHRRYESTNIEKSNFANYPCSNRGADIKKLAGKKCKTQCEEDFSKMTSSFKTKNGKFHKLDKTKKHHEEGDKLYDYLRKSNQKHKKHITSMGSLNDFTEAVNQFNRTDLEGFKKRNRDRCKR